MIQISTQPGPAMFDVVRAVGSTPQLSSEFATAMAQLLAPAKGDVQVDAAPAGPPGLVIPERQVSAAPGKILPVAVAGDAIVVPEIANAPEGAVQRVTPEAPVVAAPGLVADKPTPAILVSRPVAQPEALIPRDAKGDVTVDKPRTPKARLAPPVADASPRKAVVVRAEVPIARSEVLEVIAPKKKVVAEAAPVASAKRKRTMIDEPVVIAAIAVEPIVPVVVTKATPTLAPAKAVPTALTPGAPVTVQSEPVVAQPDAETPPVASPKTSLPVQDVTVTPPADPGPALAKVQPPAAPVTEPTPRVTVAPSPVPVAAPTTTTAATPTDSVPLRPTFRAEARAEPALLRPATAAASRQPVDIPLAAAQPAGQAFAAAMFAARAVTPPARTAPGEGSDVSVAFPLSGLGGPAHASPLAVHAATQAQGAPLDTRRDDWMTGMIERIELVRDSGPVHQAHIRLAPDALGGVDVAIREERGAVHVHITADTAVARAMIADAAPRLAELAESRGLRLGGGDAGHGHGNDQAQPGARDDTRQPTPAQRARTAGTTADDLSTDDDIRIA